MLWVNRLQYCKSALSQKRMYELAWFTAYWYKFGTYIIRYENFTLRVVKNSRNVFMMYFFLIGIGNIYYALILDYSPYSLFKIRYVLLTMGDKICTCYSKVSALPQIIAIFLYVKLPSCFGQYIIVNLKRFCFNYLQNFLHVRWRILICRRSSFKFRAIY